MGEAARRGEARGGARPARGCAAAAGGRCGPHWSSVLPSRTLVPMYRSPCGAPGAAARGIARRRCAGACPAHARPALTASRPQRRLEEEADFRAARDLFGGGKSLDDLLPKTLKDFESYAEQLAARCACGSCAAATRGAGAGGRAAASPALAGCQELTAQGRAAAGRRARTVV
jgi:hypothetical protein